MIVKQSGTTLTGSGGPDENEQWPIQNGKIDGNKITAQVTSPEGATYALTMTVDGDRISGDGTAYGGRPEYQGQSRVQAGPIGAGPPTPARRTSPRSGFPWLSPVRQPPPGRVAESPFPAACPDRKSTR